MLDLVAKLIKKTPTKEVSSFLGKDLTIIEKIIKMISLQKNLTISIV